MRAVIISRHMSGFGGTETVLAKVASYYHTQNTASDVHVDLLLPQGVEDKTFLEDFQLSDVVATRISPKNENIKLRNIRGLISIVNYLEKYKPSIVICITSKLVMMLHKLRKVLHLKFKIVSWIHFSLDNDVTTDTNQLRLADYHLAISSGIEQQLIQRGVNKERIFVIYNPITRISRSELEMQRTDSDTTEFAYVGRVQMFRQKNLNELLEAAKRLHGSWHISIVGDGDDLDLLQDTVTKAQLNENISLLGWQSSPWKYSNQYDCCLLTSTYEGFGMVLVEAISRGIPVISSDCPTGPDEIITSDNGYLYQMGDSEELARLMQCFIDGKTHFSQDKVINSLEPFYDDTYFKRLSATLLQIESLEA